MRAEVSALEGQHLSQESSLVVTQSREEAQGSASRVILLEDTQGVSEDTQGVSEDTSG